MSNQKHYAEIFDYLRGDRLPPSPESTVVFGRNDSAVAKAAGDLVLANLADVMVITGGVGKDTGDLLERGYRSEAHFLNEELKKDALDRGYELPVIKLDEAAKNGGDNARNSITILNQGGHSSSEMTAVAHATSARRLSEMLKHEGTNINGLTPDVFTKPTDYKFDPSNPLDQAEARAELLRLADWPNKDWLLPQSDLPEELVTFARDSEQDK